HYVPLNQFNRGEIHICFYESLYRNPHEEIQRILDFAGAAKTGEAPQIQKGLIDAPSRVSGKEGTVVTGASPIDSWRTELPKNLVTVGNEIISTFALGDIYNDSGLPNADWPALTI
ncbi:MAG: sulfotransferase domain-containing protein, partial [Pseudomonadota bacterium]